MSGSDPGVEAMMRTGVMWVWASLALGAPLASWCASAPVANAALAITTTADDGANPAARRTVASYIVPPVKLLRDDGESVLLSRELADSRPVVMNFIYTSCTTICPLSSQNLALLQKRLGKSRDLVRMVSISIDPEQDTPARLREYAGRFNAGPEWHHYTGTLEASLTAQRAFNVYRGDKMRHGPVVLVRSQVGGPWVRFDGFATADDLYAELHLPTPP